MRDIFILLLHVVVTFIRLARLGGIRSVIAESVLVKHQLLILNRSRERAPNLRALDRIITGLCALLMRPARVIRSAIVLRPSTVFHLHRVLVKRKYRLLFSPKWRGKPGPRGPQKELVDAIVEMKRRNPTWGCPRIAEQMTLAFGLEINKDVVRRILSAHYCPDSHSGGPSWLTLRRECLDRTLFWTAPDLKAKLLDFQRYFIEHRTHSGLNGRTPEINAARHPLPARFGSYEWKQHCRVLYQTPMAA